MSNEPKSEIHNQTERWRRSGKERRLDTRIDGWTLETMAIRVSTDDAWGYDMDTNHSIIRLLINIAISMLSRFISQVSCDQRHE